MSISELIDVIAELNVLLAAVNLVLTSKFVVIMDSSITPFNTTRVPEEEILEFTTLYSCNAAAPKLMLPLQPSKVISVLLDVKLSNIAFFILNVDVLYTVKSELNVLPLTSPKSVVLRRFFRFHHTDVVNQSSIFKIVVVLIVNLL